MRRTKTIVLILAVAAVAVTGTALTQARVVEPDTGTPPAIEGAATDRVRVAVDPGNGFIDVIVGPIDLAAHQDGYRTPIQLAQIPAGGWIHGYSWFVADENGKRQPDELLHHVNLIDPDRAELFSPTARRVIAAGRETGAQKFPGVLGYPLAPDSRFLIVSMFSNPTATARRVFLTVRLDYSPGYDRRLKPLAIYPFYLDVMGPVGDKDFPVPPGRTERSWEGSPRVDARILAIGGHLHNYARLLKLEDLTTGKVIWSVAPETDGTEIRSVPRSMTWWRGGIKLHREHRYRVLVEYVNDGKVPTEHGGMGVVAGVVLARPDWPPLDRDDAAYRTDLYNIMVMPQRKKAGGHMH